MAKVKTLQIREKEKNLNGTGSQLSRKKYSLFKNKA
jgi:hypothetical protein